MLASRAFHAIGLPFLWRTIELSESRSAPEKAAQKLCQTLDTGRRLGTLQLVRRVDLVAFEGPRSDEEIPAVEVWLVLSTFPVLRDLNVVPTSTADLFGPLIRQDVQVDNLPRGLRVSLEVGNTFDLDAGDMNALETLLAHLRWKIAVHAYVGGKEPTNEPAFWRRLARRVEQGNCYLLV